MLTDAALADDSIPTTISVTTQVNKKNASKFLYFECEEIVHVRD
jgi:hypothetical protein